MKIVLALAMVAGAALAADKKPLPNQAGNDDIELAGTLLMDQKDIRQAVGADMPDGYVVVRMRVAPGEVSQSGRAINVSSDDFTLVSRKDGERSSALAPNQVAGSGAVFAVAKPRPGASRMRSTLPTWIGGKPKDEPIEEGKSAEAPVEAPKDVKENPLYAVLVAKALPEGEIKAPIEGLLYFYMEGKVKLKDLSLLYKGRAGRLEMDFK